MKLYIYKIIIVVIMGCGIAFSDSYRNDILFSNEWEAFYNSHNIIKPHSALINAESIIWSLCYVIFVLTLAGRYSFRRTLFITFCSGFLLQWFTCGDGEISSLSVLFSTTPLFLLETIVLVAILNLFRKWEIKHCIAKYMTNETFSVPTKN